MARQKEDPRDSFKRVFSIELPEPKYHLIPELVRLFKDEQKVFRVIIGACEGNNYHTTMYDYYPTDQTDRERERLNKLFRAHVFPHLPE